MIRRILLSYHVGERRDEFGITIRDCLDRLWDFKITDLRDLGTRPGDVSTALAEELAATDLLVLLVGSCSAAPNEDPEITLPLLAYQQAVSSQTPVLAYLLDIPDEACDEGRAFRAALRTRHSVGTFTGADDLVLRLVTDLHNWQARQNGVPAAAGNETTRVSAATPLRPTVEPTITETPEPVKWLKSWIGYLLPNNGRDSIAKKLARFVLMPLIFLAALVKFDLLPQRVLATGKTWGDDAFILIRIADPRCAKTGGSDDFTDSTPTPDSRRWSAPASWRLVDGSNPRAGHQQLLVVGAEPGYFRPPGKFESYCDYAVDFTFRITDVARRRVSWILREQHSWSDRYYRFDVEFAQRGQAAKLIGRYVRGDREEPLGEQTIPSYKPLRRDKERLKVHVEAVGFLFKHTLTYFDSCESQDCADYIDAEPKDITIPDPDRRLTWGSPGFIADPGVETRVQGFSFEMLGTGKPTEGTNETEKKGGADKDATTKQ